MAEENTIKELTSSYLNTFSSNQSVSIQVFDLNKLSQKQKELKEHFEIITDSVIQRIPEAVFVQDFLPAFCGEVECSRDLLSVWYLISGGPFNPVHVVNQFGKTIITIPPMLNRDVVKIGQNSDDIKSIFRDFENMTHISPHAANNRLLEDLTDKFETDQIPVIPGSLEEQWNNVFIHYGKKVKSNQSNSKNNSNNTLEFDYE